MEHKRKRPDDGGWMEGRKGSCFHFTTIALSRELKEYRGGQRRRLFLPSVCACVSRAVARLVVLLVPMR